jgi:hypothetical protein
MPVRRIRLVAPTFVVAGIGISILAALPAEAAERPEDAAKRIAEKIKSDPGNLDSILNAYERLEASKSFDVFGHHAIHTALLDALSAVREPAVVEGAEKVLSQTARTAFPAQVLVLKAAIRSGFPVLRERAIAWLARAAESKNDRLCIWGVRLLADSRWSEAIDRLIELLRRDEAKNPPSLLASITAAELYRVLGNKGQGTAGEVQKNWEALGKKLPDSPDYGVAAGDQKTVVFFGDRISPFAVFAIDTSSSMLEKTRLRDEVARGRTGTGKDKDSKGSASGSTPKVAIVKEELKRAIAGLQSHTKFNILAYNASFTPWRGGSPLRLHTAGREAVRAAGEYAAQIPVAQGTNIHDTMAAALEIAEVETIYLLSDGIPSRGGSPAEIERRVAALNYLAGIRVVTYGFAAEAQGSYDEEFMKRLASKNWGWYRRLN